MNQLELLLSDLSNDYRVNKIVEMIENYLFSTPEGKEYLENKGWTSAEDIKKERIMQEQNKFK